MKHHPYAAMFDMMADDQIAELAESIKGPAGLIHPVVTYEGMILDGRNRWAACKKLKMPRVETIQYEGDDPIGYVMAANLPRRHLSAGQRAMALVAEARARAGAASANLQIDAAAARALRVSPRTVAHARVVDGRGTEEEVAGVKGGQVAVSRAAKGIERKEREIRDAATADPGRFQPFADRLAAGEKAAPVHKAFAREKNRQTTKGEALKDATGHEVPAGLRDLFGDPWLMQTAEAVEEIARDALKPVLARVTKKGPAYKFLLCSDILKAVEAARHELTTAHAHLAEGRPHAVHRTCEGKGCKDCRQAGWLPRWRWLELQAEGRP